MNPDEILPLATIISTEEFEGELFTKSKIHFRESIGIIVFKSNIEFIVEKIDYEQQSASNETDEHWICVIQCTLKKEKQAKLFEKKNIPTKFRNDITYRGYFMQIKSPDLENKFQLVSNYDYSVIDINNRIHREHVLKEFLFLNNKLYNFDEKFINVIITIKNGYYNLGLVSSDELYLIASELFELSLKDLDYPENLENILCIQQN